MTWIVFSVITVVTGTALLWRASTELLEWAECSEIVLMGIVITLLIWHVNRHRAAQAAAGGHPGAGAAAGEQS